MQRLNGRTALVTGGTSGIGLATVERLAAEGARVVALGRDPEKAQRLGAELGDRVTVIAADARDLEGLRSAALRAAEEVGGLDIVVLNAGVSDWRPLEAWDAEGFARVFDVNVKAPFFLLQALLPQLHAGASVVFTSSNAAHGGFAGGSVYGASKAAISAMSRSLAAELMERGLRVNAVSPGPVDTPLFDSLGIPQEHREAAMRDIAGSVPAGRMGDPAEIASAIAYLASEESSFIHGTDLVIDGGVTRVAATA